MNQASSNVLPDCKCVFCGRTWPSAKYRTVCPWCEHQADPRVQVPETPLQHLLGEIEDYLEERADADGVPSGGGYHPNRAMQLLTALREFIEK